MVPTAGNQRWLGSSLVGRWQVVGRALREPGKYPRAFQSYLRSITKDRSVLHGICHAFYMLNCCHENCAFLKKKKIFYFVLNTKNFFCRK